MSTNGPEENTTSKSMSVHTGSWQMSLHDQLSVDIALVYLSKMAAAYITVGEENNTAPISREVKDALIKA